MADVQLAIEISGRNGATPSLESAANSVRAVESSSTGATKAVKGLGQSVDETGTSFIKFGLAALGLQSAESILHGLAEAIVTFPEVLERASITFETFTGSAEKAALIMSQIQGLGGATPFHTEALLELGQRLIALGAPAEQVASQIKDISTAVAAVGGSESSLSGIALALSRIQETGIVDARIMRQLLTENIPAWTILQKAIGGTVPELQNMVRHGQITSEVFLAAFHTWASGAAAADALAKSTGTISGSLVVMQNAAQIATTTAVEPLTDRLTKLAAAAAHLSTSNDSAGWADRMAQALEKALEPADRFVADLAIISGRAQAANTAVEGLTGGFSVFGHAASLAGDGVNELTGRLAHSSPIVNTATAIFDNLSRGLVTLNDHFGPASTSLDHLADRLDATRGYMGGVASVTEDLTLKDIHLGDTMGNISGITDELTGKFINQHSAVMNLTDATNALIAANSAQMARDPNAGRTPAALDPGSRINASNQLKILQGDLAATEAAANKHLRGVGAAFTQNALVAVAGLAQIDMAIAGTSQKLAGVQLQIEQKVLARMERRPVHNLYQEEALLAEQLKVEQLQKSSGFTVPQEQLKISNAEARAAHQVHLHPGAVVVQVGAGQTNNQIGAIVGQATTAAVIAHLNQGAGTSPGKANTQLAGARKL